MHRIFTFKKDTKFDNWDEIIANDDTETLEEFDSYDEAVAVYSEKYNDPDVYGVE
jgi:hypothetical protein